MMKMARDCHIPLVSDVKMSKFSSVDFGRLLFHRGTHVVFFV